MGLSELTKSAVNQAVEEFNQLKRKAFLKKYGFGQARGYLLELNGRTYDSKAIAGAAHGYLPGQQPLTSKDFSGGEPTVKKKLEDLGFSFANDEPQPLPSPGDVLTNDEIGRRFGVGMMSGMRRNTKRNLLVLVSDPFKGLYQDRWEGDILHYTGMGKTGNQSLTFAQNSTLNESAPTKIPLHLLEAVKPQEYTYAGEVELVGAPYQEEQLDDKRQPRQVWMFPIPAQERRENPASDRRASARHRRQSCARGPSTFDRKVKSARQKGQEEANQEGRTNQRVRQRRGGGGICQTIG